MTREVLNPVEVEKAIRHAVDEVAQGVEIVTVRLTTYREAQRLYDLAYAQAYMAHRGPQTEKRIAAEIETTHLRHDKDVAEVAWKYAERRCAAAESTLSAYQTISKSVRAMYGAAGTGEW